VDLATAIAEFERWRGRGPAHAGVLAGGMKNAVFHLEDCVARFYVRDGRAGLARELAVFGMLANTAVRVPAVEHIVEELDPPLVFLRYVDGVPFKRLSQRERRRAAPSIGAALGALTRVPVGNFAQHAALHRAWRFANALESKLVRARLGVLWPPFERLARTTEVPEDTQIVHGDFTKWNVLVRHDACVAIIDWENAHVGTPLEDLGLFLRYERFDSQLADELARGFVDAGGELSATWRRDARLLDLPSMCRSLSDPRLPPDVMNELIELVERSLHALA
jgi:aminoglycoside phosphotransferase (APT) family kinase protein